MTDNNWTAVVKNLSRARKVWSRISRILSREGAAPQVSKFFFKAVVQAILLFGAETWVVTPCMGKALGGGSDPGGETAPAEDTGREVEIHLSGDGKGGGGILDDGGVYQGAAEHGRTVHPYTITVRPVCGVLKVSGGASRDVVVGIGGN